ncbi:MAG: hypothetical protein V8S95_02170 [Odoribacter sp.]
MGKSVGFWETIRDLWMEAEQELVVLKTELRIEREWDERLAVLEKGIYCRQDVRRGKGICMFFLWS